MNQRLDLRGILAFLVLAFASAWAVASPMWFSGRGLATRGAGGLLLLLMLLPRLLPLLLSGVIWGLWHAPIILLGYNYPLHPQLGVLAIKGRLPGRPCGQEIAAPPAIPG